MVLSLEEISLSYAEEHASDLADIFMEELASDYEEYLMQFEAEAEANFALDDDGSDEDIISVSPAVEEVNQASTMTPTSITLPVEVWECILINVEPLHMHRMSQISQQHLAITQSPFFRARYFYSRHMPCQAIYYATCRPKLFTTDLLKALLTLGASLPRYFCQAIIQRHAGVIKQRSQLKWSGALKSSVIIAIMNEAIRLYGDLVMDSSDGSDVKSWADNLHRSPALTDKIREIFVKGRFAVFSGDDSPFNTTYAPSSLMASAIAHHEEILQILLDNGYVFDKLDQDQVTICIFQKFATDEEGLYARLDRLLIQHPDWRMKACSRFLKDYVTTPHRSTFAPVPATEAGRILVAENGGIGPIKVPIKVMKRFYEEGRAFIDLEETVTEFVKACSKGAGSPRKDYAPHYRILFHLFPDALGEFKVHIATTFVNHFEQEFAGISTVETNRGLDKLFDLLDGLDMTRKQWMELNLDEFVVYEKLFTSTVKRGYFGFIDSMDDEEKVSLLVELVSGCIFHPMRGHHLHDIEAIAKDLFANEKNASRRNKKITASMTGAIEDALLQWQFNLDTLRPDRKYAVDHKLRSPIAWLTKGQYTVTSNSYHSPTYTTNQDPYQLIPHGGRPHHSHYNELVELTFAFPQSDLAVLEHGGVNASGSAGATKKAKTASNDKENVVVGWKHLGNLEQLEAIANDSGVMIIERDEPKTVESEVTTEDASAEEQVQVIAANQDNVALATKAVATGKIGQLLSYFLRVVRMQCAACLRSSAIDHSCNYLLGFHRQAKDLASILPLFLPADSPALRDVVLAHALVNGNTGVIKDLMKGAYREEEVIVKKEGEAKSSNRNVASKARLGQPEKPVLPTLAHWRIMQAIERKPVEEFVNRILEGAPFKRGYVQSSGPSRTKETNADERYEWYKKTGHKDDRLMTSLFGEKKQLEAIDNAAKKKKRRAAGRRGRKTKSKSKDSGDEEETPILHPTKVDSQVGQSSKEKASTRSHLRRSATQKPVRYNESGSISSDEDDDMSDGEGGSEVKASSKSASVKKDINAEPISIRDLFGHGSDLSEVSSDVEVNDESPHRSTSANAESDTDCDDDEETQARINYDFEAEDAPMVTIETEHLGIEEMPLQTLYQRCKSLKLWLDHLRLLLWFERRKERHTKEKAAKARQGGRSWERAGKTSFSKGLSDYIRRIETAETSMQEVLQIALKARKMALTQQKKDKTTKVMPKVEVAIDNNNDEGVRSRRKQLQPQKLSNKRGRIRLSDVILHPEEASSSSSSSRKKRRMTKQQHNETITMTT